MARATYDTLRVHYLRLQVREEITNANTFGAILVNSQFSAEAVARAYGLPSRVCSLGVDPFLWDIAPRQPECLVVGIGEFAPHKGIAFVLRALSQTNLPRPEIHSVGNRADPAHLAQLRKLAESLNVDFISAFISAPDRANQNIKAAAFLVYAPHLEPFGYAPLECAAAGLPTVAVAEGGIRETVEHDITGLLVARDVTQMAAAIDELIHDPERTALMGAAARPRRPLQVGARRCHY